MKCRWCSRFSFTVNPNFYSFKLFSKIIIGSALSLSLNPFFNELHIHRYFYLYVLFITYIVNEISRKLNNIKHPVFWKPKVKLFTANIYFCPLFTMQVIYSAQDLHFVWFIPINLFLSNISTILSLYITTNR